MDITSNQVILGASITASIALIVGIITAYATIYNSWKSRKNEKQLAILKVLLEAAYKEYEFRTKQEIENAKAENRTAKIKSFTEYVIFYKQMGILFSKDQISEDDIVNTLQNNKALIDTYYLQREKYRPEYHKE
jgi:hypothetical protein